METMSAVQSGSSSALSVSALVFDHSDINTTVHLSRTISLCVCVFAFCLRVATLPTTVVSLGTGMKNGRHNPPLLQKK